VVAASLLLHAPRSFEWVRSELAPPASDEVWLETLAGAISVGTEVPLYRGDARQAEAPRYPRMTGYESLGRVVALGEGVTQVVLGDRVVATYGHRTAACVRADTLMRVPDGVSDEIALLAVLANDTAKGVGKLKLEPDAVLITGAGTVGLLTLHHLRWLGFTRVDVMEPLAERRALASALGARAVFAPDALTGGGYAAGVECSSRQAAFAALQRAVEPGGQLCVLADGNVEPLTLAPEFHSRELSVVASSDGEDYPGYARAFFDRWLEARAPLAELFTLRVVARELPETFEELLADPPVKVFVAYP
jgi:alcohol dehydrogenase